MIGIRNAKTDFNSLKKLFWAAHKAFLKNHRELLDWELSERCLCGALMYELNKQLEMNGYNDITPMLSSIRWERRKNV